MTSTIFSSLRYRMLLPLLIASVLSAGLVAAISFRLGQQRSELEVRQRFDEIRDTLGATSFPLTPAVLGSLADLTATEMISINADGKIVASTIPVSGRQKELLDRQVRDLLIKQPASAVNASGHVIIQTNDLSYQAFSFARSGLDFQKDRVSRVLVLFDQERIDQASSRAAYSPLITGLSTIVLLSGLSIVISGRLVGRLIRLQRRVERVAEGDFESKVADRSSDEVGRLGRAVDAMASQLDQLWKKVHRQQSERLLHQVAGGMAHQLRNTLTGAKMAIELHADGSSAGGDNASEELQVAVSQIEVAEDYVRRLLLVASGGQDNDQPRRVGDCWDDVQASLSTIAQHLRVDVTWSIDSAAADRILRDGSTFAAALTNLVHNAVQAGNTVRVDAVLDDSMILRVTVVDNGDGIDGTVGDELFEPFVTSKPEGMGLGLAVARRAAKHHGGEVHCERSNGLTKFEITFETKSQ